MLLKIIVQNLQRRSKLHWIEVYSVETDTVKNKGSHKVSRYYKIKVCPDCGEDERFEQDNIDGEWQCRECCGAFDSAREITVAPVDHILDAEGIK